MVERLIFCETSQHVGIAVLNIITGSANYDLVVLTPEAAWECQLRGQSYLKIEDFYSEADLSTHAQDVLEDEIKWANWVDEFLRHKIPVLRQAKFSPANASFNLLRWVLDGFFEASYVLTHFLARVRPQEVSYWAWESTEPPWHLRHKNPIYSALLPMGAPRYGVSLREMSTGAAGPGDASLVLGSNQREHEQQHLPGNRLGSFVKHLGLAEADAFSWLKRSRVGREIKLLRDAGLSKYFWSLVKQSMSSARVLVIGNGYDLDPLIPELRKRGVRVTWLHSVFLTGEYITTLGKASGVKTNLQDDLAKLWPTIIEQEAFWAPLTKWGVGRNARAEIAFSVWWHRIIPELWHRYQSALKIVSRRDYLAAVAWEAGVTSCGPLLQAAAMRSIPRLIYQHGSAARIAVSEFYPYLLHSERFLVYGKGTAEHLQRNGPSCGDARAEVVPVGSSRLDALRARMNPRRVEVLRARLHGNDNRPIILYVPTIMGISGKGLSVETGYADVSYFELQERIIRLFARFPSVNLLYKEIPSHDVWNPIPDLIQREIPTGRAVLAPPLAELVWAVDAIILDHVSTALGEALLTRKRLVVYSPNLAGHAFEPPEAQVLLRKRAIVAETPDEFVEVVRTFLSTNDFTEMNAPNDGFLRAYSTHLNDGSSAERAVNEILRSASISSSINTEVRR